MPYFFRKDDDKYCVYQGTKKEPEKLIKCHPTPKEAQAHVAALMSNVPDAKAVTPGGVDTCVCPECGATAKHEPGTPCRKTECPKCGEMMEAKTKSLTSQVTFKRQEDGSYRWWAVSSVAIRDKEGEVVSERAYDDAIQFATEKSAYGDLDLVHIDGTSVGECDSMVRLGKLLIESGTMPDTHRAKGVVKAIQSDPDYWGVSIRFLPDPEQFDEETKTYLGGIRILNRTILPKWMAASYGTAISVKGGVMKMDKDAVEALKALGIPEEEIAGLAQQEKSVDPNVVEKADDEQPEEVVEETPEPEEKSEMPEPEEEPTLLKRLTDLLSHVGKSKEQDEKAKTVEPEVEAQEPPAVVEIDYDEIVKRVQAPVEEAIIEAVNKQLEPLGPLFQAFADRIEAQDKRIADWSAPIEEQVIKKLSEQPPVVKISATTKEAEAPMQVTGEVREPAPTRESVLLDKINESVSAVLGIVGRQDQQIQV